MTGPAFSGEPGARSEDPWEQPPAGLSWALGVTVPQGAPLEDGGTLSWGQVSNLTVSFRLPSIGRTDDTIYAILSAMTRSGAILQVAAGIYPGMSSWRAYVQYIADFRTYPQTYVWVTNESRPDMAPGASVSMSLYYDGSGWRYSVKDLGTHEEVDGPVMAEERPSFRVGDHEVFALEAYTSNRTTFEGTGRLTMDSLEVDGRRVVGGWYHTGGWDPAHRPLFLVGGYEPPSFISMEELGDGRVSWTFNELGRAQYVTPSLPVLGAFFAGVAAIVVAVLALDARSRKKKGDGTARATSV